MAVSAETPAPSQDVRNWSMFAHLSALVAVFGIPSFVGPLVVWLIRRDRDPVSTEHAREALNFNLSVLIYVVVFAIASVVIAIVTVGLGLLILVPVGIAAAVAWLVVVIIAAVKASNGEPYRYPVTIRLVS
jgi:uncharacterized protein